MEIKPIRVIVPVNPADFPQTQVDTKKPRSLASSFKPPEGKWTFENGDIILNGYHVATLIEDGKNKPQAYFTKLAADLAAYREYFIQQNAKRRKKKIDGREVIEEYDDTGQIDHVCALVEAYIGKIMRLLKRRYENTADGMAVNLDEDSQLVINGMNVTAFLVMARQYPTKKAKTFLKGLKNRLLLILSNKQRSPSYEKFRDVIESLINEIDGELFRITQTERLLESSHK
ncbi:hypothetical protein K1X76_06160 [bacterium]|nr:hypothetical protein [bacterium]